MAKYKYWVLLLWIPFSLAMEIDSVPIDCTKKIIRLVGPQGRTSLWRVSKFWRKLINEMQKPTTLGGCGLVDTMPLRKYTVEFEPNKSNEVKSNIGRYLILVAGEQPDAKVELWREDLNGDRHQIVLESKPVNLHKNEDNIYVACANGKVYVIPDGVLQFETFEIGFEVDYFISVAPNVVYGLPVSRWNQAGFVVIDYANKKVCHLNVGYQAEPFAKCGGNILGRHKYEPIPMSRYFFSTNMKGIFVIHGQTHELIFEIDGQFGSWNYLKAGDEILCPDPMGHLPEDNI